MRAPLGGQSDSDISKLLNSFELTRADSTTRRPHTAMPFLVRFLCSRFFTFHGKIDQIELIDRTVNHKCDNRRGSSTDLAAKEFDDHYVNWRSTPSLTMIYSPYVQHSASPHHTVDGLIGEWLQFDPVRPIVVWQYCFFRCCTDSFCFKCYV